MRDQASSLRELRANYDKIIARTKAETPSDFLAKIKRVSPMVAYVLIFPDSLIAKYPDIDVWLSAISNSPNKLYLWDQAGLINNKILTDKSQEQLSFPVLQKQITLLDITYRTDAERLEFLKNISNTLDKHNEVWVTLKSSELSYYTYLLNSANMLCIMLPNIEEATIKGYEIVKTIHNLKISAKISLLEFSSKPFFTRPYTSSKIKNVAKQFLGIDLFNVGVVLSNNKFIPSVNEGGLNGIQLDSFESESDFIYTFSEHIVNLPIGTH